MQTKLTIFLKLIEIIFYTVILTVIMMKLRKMLASQRIRLRQTKKMILKLTEILMLIN